MTNDSRIQLRATKIVEYLTANPTKKNDELLQHLRPIMDSADKLVASTKFKSYSSSEHCFQALFQQDIIPQLKRSGAKLECVDTHSSPVLSVGSKNRRNDLKPDICFIPCSSASLQKEKFSSTDFCAIVHLKKAESKNRQASASSKGAADQSHGSSNNGQLLDYLSAKLCLSPITTFAFGFLLGSGSNVTCYLVRTCLDAAGRPASEISTHTVSSLRVPSLLFGLLYTDPRLLNFGCPRFDGIVSPPPSLVSIFLAAIPLPPFLSLFLTIIDRFSFALPFSGDPWPRSYLDGLQNESRTGRQSIFP